MHQTFRSALLAAAAVTVAGGIAGFSTPAAACNSEPYIGSICTFAMDWCPYGYVSADGRTLAIREYTALFGVLGFTYGGDNANNFAIPDLRGRAVLGKGQGTGFTQSINLGQKQGLQSITLTSAQVPLIPHTHVATFAGSGGGGTGPLTASGTANLPLSGSVSNVPVTGSVSNVPVTGTITANALSKATSGSANLPSATNNTAGRGSLTSQTFYPSNAATDVAVPTTHNLTASGGTLAGTGTGGSLTGAATGTVALPVTGATGITGGTVTVAPAGQGATQAISMYPPSLGQTVCIAVLGLYPSRP